MGRRGVVGGLGVVGSRGAWRIGGYVADELIGYGASAQVWRGHVGRTAEPVALKVLDLADESAVRAARTEAALLSALDHPNLVRLRELLPDGESVVLVLELAAGGSLAQLLARRGRLSPGEVVTALSPIAAALAYAHDEGVVHCDVSPSNVLFRADGSSLLADLGVARLVGGFEPPRSTLAYVDPGVAAGAVPSESSDVFMVAATALHALTGRPPWSGDTVAAVLDHAVTGEIDGLDARLSDLPDALADVLRRGLDPSPVRRGSAAEFALDLRHSAPPVPVDLGAGPALAPLRQPGGPFVAKTDAASARAELRSQLTSSRRRDDSAVGVSPPVTTHVPRHAADNPRGERVSTSTSSEPGRGHTVVTLERPDFARPDRGRTGSPSGDRASVRGPGSPGLAPLGLKPLDSTPPGPAPLAPVPPDSNAAGVGSPETPVALTHIVRSRIRPAEPPRERRWHRHRGSRFAHVVVATIVVALLAGAIAAWLPLEPSWPHHRSAAAVRAQPGPSSADTEVGSSPSTRESMAASSSSSSRSPGSDGPPRSSGPTGSPSRAEPTSSGPAAPTTDTGWSVVLANLDLTRQQAFAADDPASLSGVYSDVALLRQDRATLRHVVAPGCHLMGLRTVYRSVHASSPTASQVVLSTRASLAPARLICPGRPPKDLAARAPVAMTLVLERVGGRFLISAIHVPT